MINLIEGFEGMPKCFKELGISPGENCVNFCEKKYRDKIQVMDRTATHACKQWRKQLRAMRKCY